MGTGNIDGVYPDRLERCWVSSPEVNEKLQECDRAIYTVGFQPRTLPATPQWGPLHYNPRTESSAPAYWAGIAFPGIRGGPLRLRPARVALKKFMDYLNSVLPLWMVYGT